MQDFGYFGAVIENLTKINDTQGEAITAAASLLADAIAEDRLIHVYGGGGLLSASIWVRRSMTE